MEERGPSPGVCVCVCVRPAGRGGQPRTGRPRRRSPVLEADPQVIELPWPLLLVLPLVPLLLPPKLLQLAETVGEQEVWGKGRVLLLRWRGGGGRGRCGDGGSGGRGGWGRARRGPLGGGRRAPGGGAGKGQEHVRPTCGTASLMRNSECHPAGRLSPQEETLGAPATPGEGVCCGEIEGALPPSFIEGLPAPGTLLGIGQKQSKLGPCPF